MPSAKNSPFINMEKGLVHIYTGGGKGKTTAAVGLCLRCSKRGFKVGFTSFLKDFESGECLGDCPFKIFRFAPFKGFWSDLSEDEKEVARQSSNNALCDIFRIAEEEKYDLIALDEVLVAAALGAVDTKLLIQKLVSRPQGLEVVMTGGICPDEILEYADYISEIKCIRHPYEKGIPARDGIEK